MQRFLARQIQPFLRSGTNATTHKFSRLLPFVEEKESKSQEAETDAHKQLIQSLVNTPIFTPAAEKYVDSKISKGDLPAGQNLNLIPQYGLMGIQQDDKLQASGTPEDRLVLANYNMPWSAFICGSQGAGKSHTLSCMLENVISKTGAGELPHPLAGLVMHYDNYTNSSTTQLCESAYLSSSGIPVKILVSPSNIWAMKRLYGNLPGLPPNAPRPKVYPLYLEEKQMTISRILKLMAFDPTTNNTPLYMEVLMSLVREMAMEGPDFNYQDFRHRLSKIRWNASQSSSLNMRLQLLDSFISPSEQYSTGLRPARAEQDIWKFEPGSLTIVDLSDPFFSSENACTLFSIVLSIFLEDRHKCGRVVAMDEAHKFLNQSGEARILTSDLTSIIRQQRHTGTRILIATQEPTLSPDLIDLANATFVHRFLSPAWYSVLRKHLAGANKADSTEQKSLFDTIVKLRTGEALLFCPTAQLDVDESRGTGAGALTPLGNGYAKLKIRKRVTFDGGKSIMASDATIDAATAAEVRREQVQEGVTMFKPRVILEKERAETIRREKEERIAAQLEERAQRLQMRNAKKAAATAARKAKIAARDGAIQKVREEKEAALKEFRENGIVYGEYYWDPERASDQLHSFDGSRPFDNDPADYHAFTQMTRDDKLDAELAEIDREGYEDLRAQWDAEDIEREMEDVAQEMELNSDDEYLEEDSEIDQEEEEEGEEGEKDDDSFSTGPKNQQHISQDQIMKTAKEMYAAFFEMNPKKMPSKKQTRKLLSQLQAKTFINVNIVPGLRAKISGAWQKQFSVLSAERKKKKNK